VSAVATTEPAGLPRAPDGVERGRAPGWWGMVFLIVTEGLFFSILLTSYFFIRFQQGPEWPPGEITNPKLQLVLIMTPILLLSSGPIHWAERGIRGGSVRRLRIGLLVTMLLGATFLVLQGFEYSETLKEFTARTNVYGTLFFTITGFHGIHVFVGLVLLGWLQFYAWRGRFTKERNLPVQLITMYWHFVDVVWVFILTCLYLSPYFFGP
jgi:heme/copper-type cytochrome/quinol oxidase subunit 3